jgi:hypothetical protein
MGCTLAMQLNRRKRKCGPEKADIAIYLNEGERLVNAYALVRPGGERSAVWTPACDFSLYIHLTGLRGFHPWRESDTGKSSAFKSSDRILRNLRLLGYDGAVTVYDENDPRRPLEATGATRRRPGDKKTAAES